MELSQIEKIKREIKEDVKEGRIKLYNIEESVFSKLNDYERFNEAINIAEQIRAEYFEEKLAVNLDKIKDLNENFINTSRLKEGSIIKGTELKIGTAKIPLSIAGPLKINGENANGGFFVPVATNEAALVAGLQRGIKALNMADEGGSKLITASTYNGMTRAPLLEAPDIITAKKFAEDINSRKYDNTFKKLVEENAQYSRFMDAKAFQIQNKIWIRLRFDTGEAMGMNSAVKYTTAILKELLDETKNPENKDIKLLALSGNLCCDKKAAMINITEGRGYKAEATVIIPAKVLKEVFNATPEKIIKLNFWKNHFGSRLAGSITGCNANAANTIAGIFAATGQDLAQVVESSTCFTFAAPIKLDAKSALKFSVTLPCLEIGTIGGGTQFGTAKEALDIIFKGVIFNGADNLNTPKNKRDIENNINKGFSRSKILAEVIAGAVLAQELNLLATLANDYELCTSHIGLARGERAK